MHFFIKRNDRVNGPYYKSQIQKGLETGRLRKTDYISESASGPWLALTESFSDSEKELLENDHDPASHPMEPPNYRGSSLSNNEKQITVGGGADSRSAELPNMKLCTYCAEPIALAAIKCKHCGEKLDAPQNLLDETNSERKTRIRVRSESDLILLISAPYEQLFPMIKQAIVSCEGKIKQDSLAEGYLVGGWKYGLNPFGLSVSVEIKNSPDGWFRVTLKGFFSDAFDTMGHAKKKAVLVARSLAKIASETAIEPRFSVNNGSQSTGTATQQFSPAMNGPTVSRNGSSGLATASLVCGILGLVFFGILLGPIALILGIVAVSNGGPHAGKAWTGMILGIIDLLAGFFLLSIVMNG